MKIQNTGFLVLLISFFIISCHDTKPDKKIVKSDDMTIRISEIEIYAEDLDDYLAVLKEESEASVRLEPGVISIYPIFEKEYPTEIRILEIYASKEAYQSHLQTPHFKKYKTATLTMVKSLKLIDMKAIDEKTMPKIFSKVKR